MKVVVRAFSIGLVVSITIAVIAAGALYHDPALYQGPDRLGSDLRRPTTGPLRVDPSNPRYFADESGGRCT